MKTKTYSIFGAGAAGLYTAWRLLQGKTRKGQSPMQAGDVLELYDWGNYNFSPEHKGTRAAGARVCTWHYKNDKSQSYLEVGGMRYSRWDTNPSKQYPNPNAGNVPGHRLVTTVISKLDLDKYTVPFNESNNTLFYLRTKNIYLNSISPKNRVPYFIHPKGAAQSPYNGFSKVEALAGTQKELPSTRKEWNAFYNNGVITKKLPKTSVFQKGDKFKDIGYWDLMNDQLGSEGYDYTSDGNGYTSNVINWNAAVALQANNEFTPGNHYYTLTQGYSSMFEALFNAIVQLAKENGIDFKYYPNTRLHSILNKADGVHYTFADRKTPWTEAGSRVTNAAWLAMPRYAIDLVAQATAFKAHGNEDVLNHEKVKLYREATVMQPSYKVGMFFNEPWWLTKAKYKPQLVSYEITPQVLTQLKNEGYPDKYIAAIAKNEKLMYATFTNSKELVAAVNKCIRTKLTPKQQKQLIAASELNTIGPSITDMPVRMVVYFGNNATGKAAKPIYGLLASYDDETFTTFWRELELEPNQQRKVPISDDTQTLEGPRLVPDRMVKMLRKQLAEIHFGVGASYDKVPAPLESRYMDWSLPPFNAGYHAWAAHYDIGDVQRNIRKPSQLVKGADANIFIVGEAYSNDQAWVEGAYCTSESVLNDFFDIEPLIPNKEYPFICY